MSGVTKGDEGPDAAGGGSGGTIESRWRQLMDQSPFGIVIYLPDGSVRDSNRTMQCIFEMTDEERKRLHSSYNILEDPELERKGIAEFVRRAFAGDPMRLPRLEYEFRTPIAARPVRRWLDGIVFPVQDAAGQVIEVVSIHDDVTEIVRAQEQMHRSQNLVGERLVELEQLYATAPVGLGLIDTDLRYVRVNDSLASLNGRSREDHVGRTVREVLPQIADILEPVLRRVIDRGTPSLGQELKGFTPAAPRDERDFLASYYPLLGQDGEVGGVSVVIQEITERKRAERAIVESEQRFREIAESIREAFWLFDVEKRRVVYVSPAYEKIWRRPVAALYSDAREWDASVHADDVGAARAAIARILETGGREFREYRIVRPDGAVRWIRDRGIAIRDGEGRVVRIAGLAEDVTDRIRAEEERRRLEAKVQHSQKLESLGVLAGGIAHDFNNLLTAMLGNADLALQQMSPESSGREFVERIRTTAQRASELTNQMLAYSGKGQFVVEAIDLNRLVREMSHLLRTVISKRAELRVDLVDDLPAIEADAGQVRQVVMNLITNASEAIGEGNGIVRVSTRKADLTTVELETAFQGEGLAPGTWVLLEVSDTGCGMSEGTRSRIFDPFFTTKFTGRGLGLAAVLGIVRGHGGAIRVESTPGLGTEFTVVFPPAAVLPAQSSFEEDRMAEAPVSATVLIVDDDANVREVASALLERAGFRTLGASDGREGVEALKRYGGQIDAVLLDATMPQMDGEQTFRRMREIRPDVPVVLCSGYSEQEATHRFTGDRPEQFVQKPYTSAVLIEKIRGVMGRG